MGRVFPEVFGDIRPEAEALQTSYAAWDAAKMGLTREKSRVLGWFRSRDQLSLVAKLH